MAWEDKVVKDLSVERRVGKPLHLSGVLALRGQRSTQFLSLSLP